MNCNYQPSGTAVTLHGLTIAVFKSEALAQVMARALNETTVNQ